MMRNGKPSPSKALKGTPPFKQPTANMPIPLLKVFSKPDMSLLSVGELLFIKGFSEHNGYFFVVSFLFPGNNPCDSFYCI